MRVELVVNSLWRVESKVLTSPLTHLPLFPLKMAQKAIRFGRGVVRCILEGRSWLLSTVLASETSSQDPTTTPYFPLEPPIYTNGG
jgi:hypothetical protein